MYRRLLLASIAAITSTLLSAVMAQQPGPPGSIPTGNPRDKMSEDKLRSSEIERVKRDAEKPDNKPETTAESRFPIIKEDFERIQIVNSDVLQSGAPPTAAPDYKRISEAAAEIKKRAARLKSNMFSSSESEKKPAEKATDAEAAADLKSLLSALDAAIGSFVSNPMFTNLKVVEAESSTKAKRDLEKVIKLSTRIKKEADKMGKTNGG